MNFKVAISKVFLKGPVEVALLTSFVLLKNNSSA